MTDSPIDCSEEVNKRQRTSSDDYKSRRIQRVYGFARTDDSIEKRFKDCFCLVGKQGMLLTFIR